MFCVSNHAGSSTDNINNVDNISKYHVYEAYIPTIYLNVQVKWPYTFPEVITHTSQCFFMTILRNLSLTKKK